MRDHRTVLQLICEIAGTSGKLLNEGMRDYPNQTYYDWNVERKIRDGELPEFLGQSERHEKRVDQYWETPSKNREEFTFKPYHDYRLKCFLKELGNNLFQTKQAIRERLEELHNAENPCTAFADGSTEQWRIANNAKIKAVEWLLEDPENGGEQR